MSAKIESPRWSRSPVLPMERGYLWKAWLVVASIVILAAAVLALALTTPGSAPSGSTPGVERIVDDGPHTPIQIGDFVCGQCR